MALKGIDLIGASKSGTGKTAAYVIPLLHRLQKIVKDENKSIRALILVPTIELADQVSRNISELSKYLSIKNIKIQGGTPKSIQLKKISDGGDIVVATLGRLQDFIKDGKINLSNVNTVILDEVDTMLELGFIKEIKFILTHCKQPRHTMMFSATVSQNIKKLAKEFLVNPTIVEIHDRRDRVEKINHRAFKVNKTQKKELVAKLIKDRIGKQILLFANSKVSAQKIYQFLLDEKIRVSILHGDIKRGDRAKALGLLKLGKTQVLVATDIASRGIDIKDLPFVINYEIPEVTDDFTHRVGRTGRSNKSGEVISILTVRDYNRFSKIERELRISIKREVDEEFEITDTQPRQKQPKKKSLIERKGKFDFHKKRVQKRKRQEDRDNKGKKRR